MRKNYNLTISTITEEYFPKRKDQIEKEQQFIRHVKL